MGILDFLKKQFVDVIDWVEEPGDLAIRYPMEDREIQNGAALTVREGQVAFTAFFESAVHKSAFVGMFLAVLELVRHQHLRAAQPMMFGEIWLEPGEAPLPTEIAVVSDYEHGNCD